MYWRWKSAVTKPECEKIIKEFNRETTYGNAKVGPSADGIEDPEMRKTNLVWIDRQHLLNRVAQSFINEANLIQFKYKLSGSERLQFGKYENGGFYEWHKDSAITPSDCGDIRKLTLMMQLSDPNDYEGGDFQLYHGTKTPIDPDIKDQGDVIVFDSRDWHRVTPVTKGARFSIVCWTLGGAFQ